MKYLPLAQFEPGSIQGPLAVECAGDQDAFWPYHDHLFRAAGAQGQAGFLLDSLSTASQELGLKKEEFTRCMVQQSHLQTVLNSRQEASTVGIRSTPSLLINGTAMENPFDYAILSAEVNRLTEESSN